MYGICFRGSQKLRTTPHNHCPQLVEALILKPRQLLVQLLDLRVPAAQPVDDACQGRRRLDGFYAPAQRLVLLDDFLAAPEDLGRGS
jgi:hypothetical protein